MAPGQQARDFIHVDDVVAVNLWFLEHPETQRRVQPRVPAARSRSTRWRTRP